MSWNRPPYNPAYSQAPGSAGSWQPGQQPYNPGYTQPPPTQSLPYGRAPHPPPTSSLHPQQLGPPPGYHGYAPAPPPPQEPASLHPPPGVSSELWAWFQSVDADSSGKISATELRQALVNNNWSHFNSETCRLLIGMFDQNRDGSIDVMEFSALWKYIQEWKECFDRFDKDKSGNIDWSELQQALQSFGYRLSVDFCKLCTQVFDRSDQRSMKFDDFIQCCVMLRSLTEGFKKLDKDRSGVITVSFEQFLEMAIDNTL